MKKIFFATLVAMSMQSSVMNASEIESELEPANSDGDKVELNDEGNIKKMSLFHGKYELSFTTNHNKNTDSPYKVCTKHYTNNLPAIYFGFSQLTPTGTFNKAEALTQKNSSYEWGMYLFSWNGDFTKDHKFGCSLNLGFSRTSIRFRDSNAILKDENGELFFDNYNPGTELDKSWLRYWSIRMPLMIGYQSRNEKFSLSAGAELEWRLGALSRVKYNGSKHTVVNDPDIEALGVNVLVCAGFHDFCIIGRLGVTDLMKLKYTNQTPGHNFNVAPFMIGVGFGL